MSSAILLLNEPHFKFVDEIANVIANLPDNPQEYKDAVPDEKKKMDQSLLVVCTQFLESFEYKSGETTHVLYKSCCEMVDYCSVTKQWWFLLVCIGGGLLLINIISVVLLIVYFSCGKKKNGGGKGKASPKTGKTTGKSKMSKTSKSQMTK